MSSAIVARPAFHQRIDFSGVISMTISCKIRLAICTLCVLLFSRSALLHADTVYDVVNDTTDQNGWNLTGTITTDGTIGTIFATNITAFDLKETDGTTTYELKSPDYKITIQNGVGPNNFTATATDLVLPFVGGFLGSSVVQFSGVNTTTDPERIFWVNSIINEQFRSSAGTTVLWNAQPPTGYGTDWVIATAPGSAVPEPSSFALFGIGGLGLAIEVFRRRKSAA